MSVFIFIIVAVVLAGAILVMGMGGIGQVGGGLEEFLQVGQKVESQFTPKDIRSICQTWLTSGSGMNDPNTIANLGLTDAFKSYPNFWDSCGEPMAALVTICKAGSDDCEDGIVSTATAYAYEVGGDFGTARGRDVVDCCIESCDIAMGFYQQCSLTSNTDADIMLCFRERMLETRPRCG